MTKKKVVDFKKSDGLTEIDAELESAMERLDRSNDRVDQFLNELDAPPETASEFAEDDSPED